MDVLRICQYHARALVEVAESQSPLQGSSFQTSRALPKRPPAVWLGTWYLRRIDSCITELKAQGPSSTLTIGCRVQGAGLGGWGWGLWGGGWGVGVVFEVPEERQPRTLHRRAAVRRGPEASPITCLEIVISSPNNQPQLCIAEQPALDRGAKRGHTSHTSPIIKRNLNHIQSFRRYGEIYIFFLRTCARV